MGEGDVRPEQAAGLVVLVPKSQKDPNYLLAARCGFKNRRKIKRQFLKLYRSKKKKGYRK